MMLEFDLRAVTLVEFGVGRESGSSQEFVAVPVDANVQVALLEMTQASWEAMQDNAESPAKYEPSDKHSGEEWLYLPLVDPMAEGLRDLHTAANLRIDAAALDSLAAVFCYFVRLRDNENRMLTALRRATQFKGIVKSRGRLIRFIDDTLSIVEDTIFKLDGDFDLLVDDSNVHMLRPIGFEFAGKLQQAILGAVPGNMAAIRAELTFVNFDGIEQYAAKHLTAARYLASIRNEQELKNVDKSALKKLCKSTGVDVSESKGSLIIADGHEVSFLQVLDRRRYQLELVRDRPEKFVAASRNRVK